jgi:hypothetical protein
MTTGTGRPASPSPSSSMSGAAATGRPGPAPGPDAGARAGPQYSEYMSPSWGVLGGLSFTCSWRSRVLLKMIICPNEARGDEAGGGGAGHPAEAGSPGSHNEEDGGVEEGRETMVWLGA